MPGVRNVVGALHLRHQDIHKELEARLSGFLGMEDTQLYSSCFDANGGVFEALLGEEDALISDALNHASIIDASVYAKLSATATRTPIWRISKRD